MSYYAIDDVQDAFDTTKDFLWPLQFRHWAKLAFVVFFIGGASGTGSSIQFPGRFNMGEETPSAPPAVQPPVSGVPSLGPEEIAIIGVLVGVLLVLGLLYAIVGAIMEFVFFESLRHEAVSTRADWHEHWRSGLRLFGFRLALVIVTGAVFALFAGIVIFPILAGNLALAIALILLAMLLFVPILLLAGLVHIFTTVFVVPIMILEGRGVIAGWRRFWPTLSGQWEEYAAYAVVGFILEIAAGIVLGIGTTIAAIVVGIPAAIIAFIGISLVSASPALGWTIIAIAAVLFLLSTLIVGLFLAVPVQSFTRYFALFVLGDTNADFDLIPDQRRAVRADSSGSERR